jgi:hypothetical protein
MMHVGCGCDGLAAIEWGSCPLAWCKSRGVAAFPGKRLPGSQLATAASMGVVSSLTSLMVASVM